MIPPGTPIRVEVEPGVWRDAVAVGRSDWVGFLVVEYPDGTRGEVAEVHVRRSDAP